MVLVLVIEELRPPGCGGGRGLLFWLGPGLALFPCAGGIVLGPSSILNFVCGTSPYRVGVPAEESGDGFTKKWGTIVVGSKTPVLSGCSLLVPGVSPCPRSEPLSVRSLPPPPVRWTGGMNPSHLSSTFTRACPWHIGSSGGQGRGFLIPSVVPRYVAQQRGALSQQCPWLRHAQPHFSRSVGVGNIFI